MENPDDASSKTTKGGNGFYKICHDISAHVGATIGAKTPTNAENIRTITFNWARKRLSHLLIQKGRELDIIPPYIHSIDVLGQPRGAQRRNKIHQYHADGENLRDLVKEFEDGEERCQREIIDPIQEILQEKLGIIARVDFWPKNIVVAPETAQKIVKSLKQNTSFNLDSEDALYVNIDPDHWAFEGQKVGKILSREDIPDSLQLH